MGNANGFVPPVPEPPIPLKTGTTGTGGCGLEEPHTTPTHSGMPGTSGNEWERVKVNAMSAEASAMVRTWSVGGYTCTLTVPRGEPGSAQSASMEWSPSLPSRLTTDELAEYRRGRDAAFRSLGINVLVLEV